VCVYIYMSVRACVRVRVCVSLCLCVRKMCSRHTRVEQRKPALYLPLHNTAPPPNQRASHTHTHTAHALLLTPHAPTQSLRRTARALWCRPSRRSASVRPYVAPAHTHTHTHRGTHTHTEAQTHTCTHTHTHTHRGADTHTQRHRHTHIHTHTYIHTHANHTYTYTVPLASRMMVLTCAWCAEAVAGQAWRRAGFGRQRRCACAEAAGAPLRAAHGQYGRRLSDCQCLCVQCAVQARVSVCVFVCLSVCCGYALAHAAQFALGPLWSPRRPSWQAPMWVCPSTAGPRLRVYMHEVGGGRRMGAPPTHTPPPL
jgi:hypothetical protein